jgi:hypothetical protein
MDPARCRGRTCRAPILFVPTQDGHTIPLNAQPDPAGNVAILSDLLGGDVAQTLGPDDAQRWRADGFPLYMPHHATCPDVEEFRR